MKMVFVERLNHLDLVVVYCELIILLWTVNWLRVFHGIPWKEAMENLLEHVFQNVLGVEQEDIAF